MAHPGASGGAVALALILGGAVLVLAGAWALREPAPPEPEPDPVPVGAAAPEPVGLGVELVISDGGLRTTRAPLAEQADGTTGIVAVEAEEREPNDEIRTANLVALDAQVAGALTPGDHDNFAVDLPAGARGRIVATLAVTIGSVSLTLYDEVGQPIATGATVQELSIRDTVAEHRIDGRRYYLLVQALDGPATAYRLHVTVRP